MAEVKQYVNRPSGGGTNDQGEIRRFRINPNTVPNVGAGDRVEWWIEADAGNTPIEYIPPNRRARLQRSEGPIQSGTFRNRLSLPPVGGDKYTVNVSKKGDRGNAISTDTFVTWRKLFYTIFHVDAAPSGSSLPKDVFKAVEADFKKVFADAFIELESVAEIPGITNMVRVDATTGSVLGRPNIEFLSGSGPRGIANLRPAQGATGRLAHNPQHMAIVLVHELYSVEDHAYTEIYRVPTVTTDLGYLLYQPGGAGDNTYVRRAHVRWTGRPWQNVRARFNDVKSTSQHSQVSWDLSNVAGLTNWLAAAPANTITVRYNIIEEDENMGWAWCNLAVIRTKDPQAEVLQTLTHEVGHTLDMTVRGEPRWDASGTAMAPDYNPSWHNDVFGGQGPHCTENAVLRPAGLTEGRAQGLTASGGNPHGQIYDNDGSGATNLCTMFWRGDGQVNLKGEFCATTCQPRIKRNTFDRSRMRSTSDVAVAGITQESRWWHYIGR
jgi:hypothetical protein